MKLKAIVAALCAAVAVSSYAVKVSKSVPKGWSEDFAAAQKTAEKEKKLILLAFSGSDWCGWCVKMDKEVYSDKKFIQKAKDKFVLVMIDTPQNKDILTKLAQRQNPTLVSKYSIRGFPCSIVVKPNGDEVKRFGGYQRGGPEAFLEKLDEVAKAEGVSAEQVSKK
jgi:protein disulfide-isomerase